MEASVVSNVSTVASKIVETVSSIAATSGIAAEALNAESAIKLMKTALTKLPLTFYVKIGMVFGLAIASAIVLIRRWMKQRQFKEEVHTSGTLFNDYEVTADVDPIDEYLGLGYSEDPDKFSELDPLMQKIARNVSPSVVKKISKKEKRALRRILQDHKRKAPEPEFVTWARGVSKSYLAEVDKAAREIGLDVEYTIDDNMPLSRRRRFNEKLGFGYLDDIG